MTDGQPGQNANTGTEETSAQDAGFNVTFDEGTTGDRTGGTFDNTAGTNQGSGENTDNTGATDTFDWVPENYREEFKNDEGLSKYTSQEDFIRAMLEDRKANGEAIKLPGADATEEEWSKIYDKLGRPANPEGYELSKTLPEGLELNEDMYNEFIQNSYTAGLSKKQAIKLYDYGDIVIYGKTGTGRVNENDINGWFIGFIEKNSASCAPAG